jgi:hypothetical protein
MNRGIFSGLVEGPEAPQPWYDASGNLGIGYLANFGVTEQAGTVAAPAGTNNIGLGNGALQTNATGYNNVAIGVNATVNVTNPANTVVIGNSAIAAGTSVIIGASANGANTGCVAIGQAAVSGSGTSSIAIGQSANGGTSATGSNIAIGNSATAASGAANVVIGPTATAGSSTTGQNTIIGYGATANGAQNVVAIGYTATSVNGTGGGTVVGAAAFISGNSVAIGYGANVSGTAAAASTSSVTVGYGSSAGGASGVAIGYQANNQDTYGLGPAQTVAVGGTANAKGTNAVAIGYGAYATQANQFVLGNPANTTLVWAPAALIVGNPGNVLTANQSALTLNATTGWAAGANSTIASVQPNANLSTAYALYGEYALSIKTSTSTDTSSATTPTGVSGFAVTSGTVYTAVASIANGAGSPVNGGTVGIAWYDGASLISTSTSSTVTPSGAAWSQASITAAAPATATFAAIILTNLATVTTEVYLFDCIGFWQGPSTQWTLGGTAAAGSLTVTGTVVFGFKSVVGSATYNMLATDHTVVGPAGNGSVSGASFSVVLPSPATPGATYTIKNAGSGTLTVNQHGSETIDGATSIALATQYEGVTVQSDGTNWWVIGQVATSIL